MNVRQFDYTESPYDVIPGSSKAESLLEKMHSDSFYWTDGVRDNVEVRAEFVDGKLLVYAVSEEVIKSSLGGPSRIVLGIQPKGATSGFVTAGPEDRSRGDNFTQFEVDGITVKVLHEVFAPRG